MLESTPARPKMKKWNLLLSLFQLWSRNSEGSVFIFSNNIGNQDSLHSVFNLGVIIVSPLAIAPVCNGGRLEVTCTTTEIFLRWNITFRDQELVTTSTGTFTRTLSSFGTSPEASPLTINSSTFRFLRTSDEGRVPLMSTLLINPVNRMLNGTILTCMKVSTSDSSATIVQILSENDYCELLIIIICMVDLWKHCI